ncbi:MAG: hypothetical protein RMJ67_05590 [Elusimicrobiota bacterium]|nr:hypothetical protein [Endomicrobiia bacterium]MDW8165963.1 hypothetical protein [Elusimicrobiota bacterium]
MFLKTTKAVGWLLSFLLLVSFLGSIPQPITDLQVVSTNFRQIKIRWTVPLASERICYYQIRVSTYRVLSTEEDWNNNSTEAGYPYIVEINTSPPQGEIISYTFTNLENFKTYFFAIKSSTSPNKTPLSDIDNNPIRPYGQPINNTPYWTEIAPVWPIYGVVVSSFDFISFDFKDAFDLDINYGDTLKYEIYYSTKPSSLFGSTPPSLSGAYIGVIFNLTTSYAQLPTNNFLDDTTYYWRIKVIDSEGSYNWSIDNQEICKFVINHTPQPPSTFTLISPANKSKVFSLPNGVFFDWEEAYDRDPNDKVSYSLYISSQSENKGFNLVLSEIYWSSYTLSSIFGGSWVENQRYWWFVKAKDSFSLESFSLTYYFIINNYEEAPKENFLISPGNTIYYSLNVYNQNQILFTLKPTFYWTPSYDLDLETTIYYQIFISSFSDQPTELNSIFYSVVPIFSTYYILTENVLQDRTTYFWRVRIWDEPYSGYAVYSSSVFWFYTYTKNTPPTAATLKFPMSNFTTSYFYPKFEWDVGKDEGFNASLSSQTLVLWDNWGSSRVVSLSKSTSFYLFSEPLKNNTTYFWQIITYDNGYPPPQLSSASLVYSFYIKNSSPLVFNLLSPNNGQLIQTQNIQLFWQPSVELDNEPVRYKIVYSTDNFLSFASSEGVTNTNFIFYNLQDNTTYWWYVYAYDRWGFSCGASSTFYFVVDNIESIPFNFELLFPQNNSLSFVTSTTFYWQQTSDPDPFEDIKYTLMISTDPNFFYVYFSTTTHNNYFYLQENILSINTTYFWTVLATSLRSGQRYASNGPFKFFIYNTAPTKPILAFPVYGQVITTSTLKLSWSSSVDLQNDYFWYELYISSNFNYFDKIILPNTQNEFQINLKDDTTYWWYVVAVDTYSNLNQSEVFIFYSCYENLPPTKPVILQPQDKQQLNLPYIISWSPSLDLDIFDTVEYRVEISTINNFGTKLLISSTTATNYSLKDYTLSHSTYYVRVVAYDKYNLESYSDIVSFIISSYKIELFSPLNQQLIEKLPIEFSYSKVEPIVFLDTITYRIVISSDVYFSNFKEIKTFSTFYQITSPPLYPSTYFWYVEVQDSYFRTTKSPTYSFIIPTTPPNGLEEIFITTSSLGVELRWNPISIENLWGYRIYRGYTIEKLTLIDFTTGFNYIDEYGLEGDFYYTVKTINQFGVESEDNIYVRFYNGQQVDFYLSQDGVVSVIVPKIENIESLFIEKITAEENEFYPYVYEIVSNKNKTENFIYIQFIKPRDIENYCIEYYDGYLWQEIPFFEFQGKITIKTQYFGKYRLVSLSSKKESAFAILGCSPNKKIITPNNDGQNDYIEFHFEVGSYIVGYLYDLNLKKVTKLKNKDKNILYFDGKDEKGNFVLPGVYIYHITTQPDNKNFTGTIVIKY